MDHRDQTNSNVHVIEYLKYYVDLEAPRYAVLLNGPWGSGKTYLIQKFLEEHFSTPPSKLKSATQKASEYVKNTKLDSLINNHAPEKAAENYIYISLYGVKSAEDINDRIVASAFPGLGIKASKIMGGIVKSALKFVTISTDLSASDFISKFHKKIYIFDDLERCEIPLKNLLGYINQFIEHGEKNVIIIADKDEIAEKDEFSKAQEKLIGKTLHIDLAVDDATTKFLQDLNDKPSKAILLKNSESFSRLFKQSGSKSLRILQQAIREIERPLEALTSEQLETVEGVLFLAKLIFIFSVEIKSLRISPAMLEARPRQMEEFYKKHLEKNELEKAFCDIEACYTEIDLRDPILSNETLADIILHGRVNIDHIKKSVSKNHFFKAEQDERALDKLSYAFEMTEKEFKKACTEFEIEYQQRKFKTPEDILLSFSRRRWLSEIKLLNVSMKKVSEQGEQYLADLYERRELPVIEEKDYQKREYAEFNGSWMSTDFKKYPPESNYFFKKFVEYSKKTRQDNLPSIIKSLMTEMRESAETFTHRLSRKSVNTPSHINAEILFEIDTYSFSRILLELHPVQQSMILNAFSSRYSFTGYSPELSGEGRWLRQLTQHLEKTAKTASVFEKSRIQANIERYLKPHISRT